MADRFLHAETERGTLFACVCPGFRFVVPKVASGKLGASLHPYPDEQSGRAALIAAGGENVRGAA